MRERFGKRIRLLRKERNLSQTVFSDMIGMDRSYLVEVEHGRRNVSFDNIAKIAIGFDVTVSELCRGIDFIEGHEDHVETIRW